MKKSLFVCIVGLMLFSIQQLFAQEPLHEKRIYLIDVSASMIGEGSVETPNIFDDVKNNLKDAISVIKDGSTEIVIIPFTDRPLTPYHNTIEHKGDIIKYIKDIAIQKGNTNINAAWTLGSKQIDKECINYMFLLTDGLHNSGANKKMLESRIANWNRSFNQTYAFGFYVTLTPNAGEVCFRDVIDSTKNLWSVKTLNLNTAILKTTVDSKIKKNIRSSKTIDIRYESNNSKVKLDNFVPRFAFEENPYYEISDSKKLKRRNTYRLTISPKKQLVDLPSDTTLPITIQNNQSEYPFIFFNPSVVYAQIVNHDLAMATMVCEQKKSFFRKKSNQSFGKETYYEPFMGVFGIDKENSILAKSLKCPILSWAVDDTSVFEQTYIIKFNDRAIHDKSSFSFKLMSEKMPGDDLVSITYNGKSVEEYMVRASAEPQKVVVRIKMHPNVGRLNLCGGIVSTSNNIDQINKVSIDQEDKQVAKWSAKHSVVPAIGVWLLWGLIVVIAVLLLILLYKLIRYIYHLFPNSAKGKSINIKGSKEDNDLTSVVIPFGRSKKDKKSGVKEKGKKTKSKEKRVKEDVKKEGKKEDVKKEGKKEDVKKEGKKEDVKKEGKKEDVKKVDKKEDAKKEDKKEDAKKEDKKEDAKKEDKKEDVKEEDKQEDVKEEDKQEEVKDEELDEEDECEEDYEDEDEDEDEEDEEEDDEIVALMKSGIKFYPWVGDQYLSKTPILSNQRVMILGDNQYFDEEIESDEEIEMIDDYLTSPSGLELYKRVYSNFDQALYKKGMTKEERKDLWNHIIFYNYIQQFVPKGDKPTKEDYIDSKDALNMMLEMYCPTKVIVWGKRLSEFLKKTGSYVQNQKYRGTEIETWTMSLTNGQLVEFMYIHQPTLFFNINYWHNMIYLFLENRTFLTEKAISKLSTIPYLRNIYNNLFVMNKQHKEQQCARIPQYIMNAINVIQTTLYNNIQSLQNGTWSEAKGDSLWIPNEIVVGNVNYDSKLADIFAKAKANGILFYRNYAKLNAFAMKTVSLNSIKVKRGSIRKAMKSMDMQDFCDQLFEPVIKKQDETILNLKEYRDKNDLSWTYSLDNASFMLVPNQVLKCINYTGGWNVFELIAQYSK